MPQYTIYGIASASKVLGVIEAPSEKDAVEIAWADDAIREEWERSFSEDCALELHIGDIEHIEAVKVE